MGLDMYLTKKIYIGAKYAHNNVKAIVDISVNGKPVKINVKKISEIIEEVGYWRKANQIHNWFVEKVQLGVDNCQEHYVRYEQLLELKNLCIRVLETKDASLLPPKSGFFFGSTSVDENYFNDIEDTVRIINGLDPEGDYYYSSSW